MADLAWLGGWSGGLIAWLISGLHSRKKIIDVRFHKIRKLNVTGDIILEKVHISENVIDMLTKPVTAAKFKHCLDLVNVCFLW